MLKFKKESGKICLPNFLFYYYLLPPFPNEAATFYIKIIELKKQIL
ncbi:hypothetical protein D927_03117 [Enterococcus faecalis 02-MB-BW-10]|nr:hypothetical protein D927_03117 [Enterococcus faecalis 02-MB-BW-10]DAI89727.1 MAG TPA: hypothetical protein [Caudoviricetes sp.]